MFKLAWRKLVYKMYQSTCADDTEKEKVVCAAPNHMRISTGSNESSLTFTAIPAENGWVFQRESYDPRTDKHSVRRILIQDSGTSDDITKQMAEFISMEFLRG